MKALVGTPFENVVLEFEHLESLNWLRRNALWLTVMPTPDAKWDDPVKVQCDEEYQRAMEMFRTGNYG